MMRALFSLLCVLPVLAACNSDPDGPRFVVQDQGTEVRDTLTGLVWQMCPQGMGTSWPAPREKVCLGVAEAYTWDAAQARAQAVATQSGKAWRLPTVHELHSVTLDVAHGHAWAAEPFPAHLKLINSERISPYTWPNFWSANAYDSDPARNATWFVSMDYGNITNWKPSQPMYVRLVR